MGERVYLHAGPAICHGFDVWKLFLSSSFGMTMVAIGEKQQKQTMIAHHAHALLMLMMVAGMMIMLPPMMVMMVQAAGR
jgi:Ca2+/H+ antiporter